MIQGIVYVRNGKGILFGHCVNPSVIYAEGIGSILLLTRQTGDAHGISDGSMSISSKISSSAWSAESVGRRGDCLIGKVSPMSMSCCRSSQ